MATSSTATTRVTRLSVLPSLTALLLCFFLCQQQCSSFQPAASRSKTLARTATAAHHQINTYRYPPRHRSTSRQSQITTHRQAVPLDDEAAEAADTEKAADANASVNPLPISTSAGDANDSVPSQQNKNKRPGVWWKTAALALPLFAKFIIVMVIKFLTDLVVFPLLMLYRFARLTKRRILGFFRSSQNKHGKDENVNGNSSSSL